MTRRASHPAEPAGLPPKRRGTARRTGRRHTVGCGVVAFLSVLVVRGAAAETLSDALAHAYATNPQLNGERARQRGTDESVPQALSGYRPQIGATLNAGVQSGTTVSNQPDVQTGTDALGNSVTTVTNSQSSTLFQRGAALTVTQPIFDGFRTANTVRQAEATVRAGRETLRNVAQTVLLNAATAYMDVLQNSALVEVQRNNVATLGQTLAVTRRRYELGDVTPTDVAQAEARLSRGQSDLNAAETALAVSRATYAQVIGREPRHLAPASPPQALLPRTRDEALAIARRENPLIVAAGFDVDTAQYAVKSAEANFLPSLSLQGSLARNYNPDPTTTRTDTATVMGVVNIPIYTGGLDSSKVRQAKAALGQSRTALDQARVSTQANVRSAWASFEATRTALAASTAEVRAAEIALVGVRNEARAGQRTVLDVLNALQDLVNAQARLIQAQHDRVVAGYMLLSAVGRLDPARLGLKVREYRPEMNYEIVRDKWGGTRTPTGE